MKKNVFFTILLVIVAFLATSCNNYEVKSKRIDGTKLEYFSAQNPQTGGDLWGIREIGRTDGTNVIAPIYQNITKLGDFFILQTKDSKKLATAAGEIIETSNFNQAVLVKEPLNYIAFDQNAVYLIKEKKYLGPWTECLLTKNGIFSKGDAGIGMVNFEDKEILPVGQKEVIVVTQTKKVKGKEVTTVSLLAKNQKNVWTLYDNTGKKIKTVQSWELKKYTKNALSTGMDGVSISDL